MTPSQPWAKIQQDRTGQTERSHHLIQHSLDTAAVLHRLLSNRVVRRRLARAGGRTDLSTVEIARLCVIGGGHDMGKANAGFLLRADADDWPGKPQPAGHTTEALALFDHPQLAKIFAQVIGYERVKHWCDGDGLLGLFMAALSHHGFPVRPATSAQTATNVRLWANVTAPDGTRITPTSWLRDLFLALRAAYPEAWCHSTEIALPDSPRFQDAFAGLVSVADWVASTETADGEAGFPWQESPSDAPERSRDIAERLCARIGLTSDLGPQMNPRMLDLERIIGAKPNPLQQAVARLPLDEDGSLALIEAPTGSGKTEAVLIHFLRNWLAGNVAGLYFALPTRTSAVQIHGRIVQLLHRLLGWSAPPVVLAVPGYQRLDDLNARPTANYGRVWRESPGARAWAVGNPAGYMAAPIVIGTIDQALMSVIAVKHAHLRASLLSRMMLVVDEVHASDTYMTRIGTELIQRHRALGGHVALMSATCGGELAARLTGQPAPDVATATRRPYPAITHCAGDHKPTITRIPWRHGRTVKIDTPAIMDHPDEMAARAFADAQRGAKVLVIVNTVARAMAVQAAVERLANEAGRQDLLFTLNGRACPHHGKFAAEDRRALDEAAVAALGRGRPAGGLVLVATQTLEQSIDVDADILYSDLCPMDVLLQRLGRLHRHADAIRPAGFKRPRAVIAMPTGELSRFLQWGDHGIGTAYLDVRIIEATRRELVRRDRLRLPQEARTLVESAVHTDALDTMVHALGGPWQWHSSRLVEALMHADNAAGLVIRDIDHAYHDPTKPAEPADTSQVKTRLGAPDMAAVFHPKPVGPFGHRISRIAVPEGYAKGAQPKDRPQVLRTLPGGGLLIQFGFTDTARTQPAVFVYDRHGLRVHAA